MINRPAAPIAKTAEIQSKVDCVEGTSDCKGYDQQIAETAIQYNL